MSTENLPAEIRDALARLETLDVVATSEHVEVFEEMNRRLADALADLDGSGGGAVAEADRVQPRPGPIRPVR
ncbi:hypothetical protein [Frankia tisae]|uniref:hypothetical protein n=1 Tax=Frankia tisae TaxID=2950104 RepID=UPI0021BFC69E|nr:hypothetical protein [Frankia tisae]